MSLKQFITLPPLYIDIMSLFLGDFKWFNMKKKIHHQMKMIKYFGAENKLGQNVIVKHYDTY